MFTVFAWYKWRNCTQSRLVLGKLYTIAVFLPFFFDFFFVLCFCVTFRENKTKSALHFKEINANTHHLWNDDDDENDEYFTPFETKPKHD